MQCSLNELKEPLVSIIMPTYNSDRYVDESISSVINQTYKNWELIIVDDYSTDNTLKLIKNIKSKNPILQIKIIELKTNSGAAVARNAAMSEANGKYIAFLDSDDLWKTEKLTKQVEYMERNNQVFTYTNYEIITKDGNSLSKEILAPTKMSYNDLLKNTAIGCLTVMLNKDKIGNMMMPNIRAGQDTAFWLSILKNGQFAYNINENLALYRRVEGSLSSNKLKALKRTWNIYRKVENFNLIRSAYFFFFYVFNAIKKRI